MLSSLLPILLASASLIDARSLLQDRHALMHKRANDDATATTLSPDAIQSGSFNDGSDEIGNNEAQQAKSQTSTNNFINNCAGKTLTNGLQITTGSCNGIPMGDIPAKTNMVSSIITFPLAGSATIESDTTFNITVQMSNLVAGSFTNADATYYSAPQQLSGGNVLGHTHVTVQDMGASLNPTVALDATQFAFFHGINDPGNGKGLLQAVVTGGLPAGHYRVCTLASASNHQAVLMPVAQRGTADDCTKFTVIGSGTTANAAANDGSGGEAAAALAASAVAAGPDVAESSVASSATESVSTSEAAASATIAPFSNSTATATGKSGKGGKGGKGGKAVASQSKAVVVESSTTSSAAAVITSSSSKSSSSSGKKSSSGASKKIITEIETFFEFAESLGGLCPSVSRSGSQFSVFEELFDDLQSAAAASCGHQFTACTSISGPGFSIEECTSQKDSCSSAASSAKASAAPTTITATVRFVSSSLTLVHQLLTLNSVPVTVSVTGSILSSSVIPASSIAISTDAAAIAQTTSAAITKEVSSGVAAIAQTTSAAVVKASSSTPCLSTQTVFVTSPAATGTLSSAFFSNSTRTAV
ncbi:hypothetical protein D0Z07_7946 [Hyphodiscus hymeniophilus]|uniref:Uncharacterized protein n=1 Tax=Hyphodiscus hymeniophilus TaxID=353542 RepID=A0A9P6SL36_9HELO|nr:hypothetical protein D0Z07_7946 [Hyphodiscus hymeniophilus]